MSSVKKATVTSLLTALCYVLPVVFHALGAGSVFSPMHIPVLLCGLLCGWPYGLFCGAAGPVLSSLLSGMPSAVQLIWFIPELAAYGFFTGLFYEKLRTGRTAADLLASLLLAMVLGRLLGGAAQFFFYRATGRAWSVALWASAYLIGTLPGIAAQLVLVPAVVLALTRAGLIPKRSDKKEFRL